MLALPPVYEIGIVGSCGTCDIAQEMSFLSIDIDYSMPPETCTICGGTYLYETISVVEVPRPDSDTVERLVRAEQVVLQTRWPETALMAALPVEIVRALYEVYRHFRIVESYPCGSPGFHVHEDDMDALAQVVPFVDPYVLMLEDICIGPQAEG